MRNWPRSSVATCRPEGSSVTFALMSAAPPESHTEPVIAPDAVWASVPGDDSHRIDTRKLRKQRNLVMGNASESRSGKGKGTGQSAWLDVLKPFGVNVCSAKPLQS